MALAGLCQYVQRVSVPAVESPFCILELGKRYFENGLFHLIFLLHTHSSGLLAAFFKR